MTDDFLVLFPREDQPFAALPQKNVVREMDELERSFRASVTHRYVAFDSVRLVRVVGRLRARKPHRLLLLETQGRRPDPAHESRLSALRSLFRTVVCPTPSASMLPLDELFEALASPRARDLAVAVTHDPVAETVYVLRGNLETATFPESAFHSFANGPEPDFSALKVEDCGQTLQAGDFEAAFDALLYEHDPDFRRRQKQHRRASEKTLGASIRRLRTQRGLRQSDFSPLSAKEIARIERGEVKKPRAETLKAIAKRFGVPTRGLEDY